MPGPIRSDRLICATLANSLLLSLLAVYSTAAEAEIESSTTLSTTFAGVLDGAEQIDGFVTLYRKGSQLYAVLRPEDLDSDLLVLISIARGIAQRPLFSGATWNFGDDWVCQFRYVDNRVHLVRRNIHYRAERGSPADLAVEQAYSDSILATLPIVAKKPSGSMLVDMSPAFLSDLPHIESALPNYEFSPERSTWSEISGFRKNIELQVAATYTSDGTLPLESVPDARAVTIGVHYSISPLPKTNYRPRIADDRIGYFLSVAKDYSRGSCEDRFVRYINRWQLEKQDPTQMISPPKEPVVFWIEKTVPYKYRDAIRTGILEWNKAFAKIGFQDAIEVRQQPDNATWHPGDIRYNTFRWTTSGISVAMGPSRVNPLTGQILDADIVFDADYLQMWKRKYESFSPEGVSLMTGGSLDLAVHRRDQESLLGVHRYAYGGRCACQASFSHQVAMSSTILARTSRSQREIEKLTLQGVRKVAMHEAGHTLGLRHNFKGSTLCSLEEAYQRSLSEEPVAMAGSVMDYLPAQLAPGDMPQGNYYTATIGPYDYWAIEYGYRQFDCPSTEDELPYLQRIASRSAEPGHAYATDEDTRGIDADPHSGVFDFGNDLIDHAENQARLVAKSWPDLIERVTHEGEGYQHARQAFGVLMATHCRAMFAASKYVGGIHSTRSHRGDPGALAPYTVVDANTQRRALDLLCQEMFSDQPFEAPLRLSNHLAVTYWNHWGSEIPARTDFPTHESVLNWQDRVLQKLLSPLTLTRLHDSELMVPANQDAFSVAELVEQLTAELFAEVATTEISRYSNRQPAISSLRRNLQSALISRLESLLLEQTEVPSDCRAVVSYELDQLAEDIRELLDHNLRLDTYSKAHLKEVARRIDRALSAK